MGIAKGPRLSRAPKREKTEKRERKVKEKKRREKRDKGTPKYISLRPRRPLTRPLGGFLVNVLMKFCGVI